MDEKKAWSKNVQKHMVRIRKVLLLPYPNLRHLVVGWKEIGACGVIVHNLRVGQLQTCVSQGCVDDEPLVVCFADSFKGSSCNAVQLMCGPEWLASASQVSQVLGMLPNSKAVYVVVDKACGITVDEIVECVARMTNRRLRRFSLRMVNQEEVHITDKGIEQLVAFCPLMEELTLVKTVHLTVVSMLTMHARWFHTLRRLEVYGGKNRDDQYQVLGDKWAESKLDVLEDIVKWFNFPVFEL